MRTTFCLLILGVFSVAHAEDVTITSKVTHDGTADTSVSYITSDRVRFSQPDGNTVIVDFKTGDMTMINAKKQTYSVMTQKELDDLAAQMNSPEMKQAQEQMKNLPPDVKAKMEAAMGDMFKVKVEKLGTSRTIAGYRCDNYIVNIGQMSASEQCLTSDVKLPAQAWDRYKKYSDTMRSMLGAFGPMAKSAVSMRDELAKAKGLPLASKTTMNIMGRQSVSTTEVTSIKYGAVPASAFDIPAGYKQVDSPLKNALGRRSRS